MSPEQFNHLLGLVEKSITKEDANLRKAISAGERLTGTLRLLASGESQLSLSFRYLIGKSTLSRIIRETCDAIFEAIAGKYLHTPSLTEDWGNIALNLQETRNLPHVRIQCPKQSRTLFHNYERSFSFVLLAIFDAHYCFTLFDVGQYGSNNNAGVLANSSVDQKIEAGEMNIPPPPPRHLDGCLFDSFLVGDEIFPPKTCLMRPYPGEFSEKERILPGKWCRVVMWLV